MYPNSLKDLIESFKFLPGIGEKSAERMAFYILGLDFQLFLTATTSPLFLCLTANSTPKKLVCRMQPISQAGRGLLVHLNRLNRYQCAGVAQDIDCYSLCLRLHGKKHLG